MAVVNGSNNVGFGSSLSLDGSSSYDQDQAGSSITAYEWDLNGDGTIDTSGSSISLSWSTIIANGGTPGGTYTVTLRVTDNESTTDSAINYARSLGSIIIIAAAGNESAAVPGYPARFSATDDNVISVGAYSSSGSIASFSNRVGNSGSVQIDAPGVGIYSTYLGGGYATMSGTSMASPHIAGLAALTLSANPSLTSRELRDLLATGTSGRAVGSDSFGKANASITVAYAAAGLKTVSIASAGQRVATTTGTQRTVTAQATAANDQRSAASEPIAKIDFKQADVTIRNIDPSAPTSLPIPLTSKPLLLDAVIVTRTKTLDDFFASYDADERDAETSSVLRSLV